MRAAAGSVNSLSVRGAPWLRNRAHLHVQAGGQYGLVSDPKPGKVQPDAAAAASSLPSALCLMAARLLSAKCVREAGAAATQDLQAHFNMGPDGAVNSDGEWDGFTVSFSILGPSSAIRTPRAWGRFAESHVASSRGGGS